MNRKIISSIVVLLVVGLLVAAIPPAKAQFVIASWDFPDEYGQGIYGFFPLENSSGDWWPYSGPMIYFDNDTILDAEIGISLGLDVRVYLNYTLLNLTHPDDMALGPNYFRLNVTVMNNLGSTIFSQNNFTYDDLCGFVETDIWYFSEEVYFDFLTVSGEIYTATVTYEIFF